MTLCREVWPRTSSTRPRGQSSTSASSRSNASFAAASTGGAVTLMRKHLAHVEESLNFNSHARAPLDLRKIYAPTLR